jgi:hypothetical protein
MFPLSPFTNAERSSTQQRLFSKPNTHGGVQNYRRGQEIGADSTAFAHQQGLEGSKFCCFSWAGAHQRYVALQGLYA